MNKEPDCKTFCKLFAEAKLHKEFYEETCKLKQCKYFLFYESVACLLVEGPDLIDSREIFEAIKREFKSIKGDADENLEMDIGTY